MTRLPPPVGAVARVASRHYGADPTDGVSLSGGLGSERVQCNKDGKAKQGKGMACSCVCQRTDTTADDAQLTAIVPMDMDRSS